MIPHSIIIDDFLPDFAGWRSWADSLEYEQEINPIDGVAYPGIYNSVPMWGMRQRLSMVMGTDVQITAMFLRLSLEGMNPPHFAHTDKVMGQFSCMVYLNREEHCQGGTALLRHRSGMDSHPVNEEQVALWERDTNDPSKWIEYAGCEMKPNRAFIFRGDLFHGALPLGGFGTCAGDGRLVMTTFFNIS